MINGNERRAHLELMWGDASRSVAKDTLLPVPARKRMKRKGQARILSRRQLEMCLAHVRATSRTPESDELKLLLSHLAGLRACEIAGLPVEAFLNAEGRVAKVISVAARYSKSRRSRTIPMHADVRDAFRRFRKAHPEATHVTVDKKSLVLRPQSANTVSQWFRRMYLEVGMEGCSSHSGRRTFITELAKRANNFGNSLRDVQYLAGHARLDTTERYIDLSDSMVALVASLGDPRKAPN